MNTDGLSLEEKIINFLKQNQKITVKNVQNLLNLKTTQSKEILYKLVGKSYIKKNKQNKRKLLYFEKCSI